MNVADGMTDPLHQDSGPDTRWTTVNTAEALPGVPTPLGWTLWNHQLERAMRGAFCDIGCLPPSAVRVAERVDDRYSAIFFGRFTANVDQMRAMGDLMPGTSADALEQQLLGGVGEPGGRGVSPRQRRREPLGTAKSAPTLRRYPVVAAKMPVRALRIPKLLAARRAEIDAWWRATVAPGAIPDGRAARARFKAAIHHYETVMRPHSVATMLAQALYDQVSKLAAAAGKPGLETRLTTGYGQLEETALMADLWAVSRDRLTLDRFLATHGYHGPAEGEVSSRSWREDPAPLEALLATYRTMDDSAAPTAVEGQRVAEREAAAAELLAGLSPVRRPGATVLLGAAKRYIPLREVGKAAFLQALDGARAAARVLGEELARAGTVGAPDDVFYLTVDELLGELPAEPKEVVAYRRGKREEYLGLRLPDTWTGVATPSRIEASEAAATGDEINGLAVSPGVVEGRARVVLDAATTELEPGEVLVCETTDPSWASLFLVASALVIDIGGALSHGAIVARELGVPCVINTRLGTRRLRTGDLLRVDGGRGVVTVLAAAGSS
ncbi:MAG: rifampicin phosphotransferase [Actinomycetota bacterium]|nr:rifampicin phosphotransferase [Actinomycetota bacterium]